MTLRIEVKVDGKVVRVEEIETDKTDKNYTRKIWDFLYRGKKMIENLCVDDLIY